MANRQPDVPEMFREVFDLADKLVERITDTDVEARLRRLLEDRGVSRQASAELTAPEPCPSSNGLAKGYEDEARSAANIGKAFWRSGAPARVAYEVTLGPAAIQVLTVADPSDRKELAAALRGELMDGPNADKEFPFDADGLGATDPDACPPGAVYTATPLSFGGYTVIHRPLTEAEIWRLQTEKGRSTVDRGFYVIEILPAESAFNRSTRSGC